MAYGDVYSMVSMVSMEIVRELTVLSTPVFMDNAGGDICDAELENICRTTLMLIDNNYSE